MAERMYPAATPEIAARRRQLAPEINAAFENFSHAVFAEGALPEKTKQLIAVCGSARDPVPVLHHGTHQARPPQGSKPKGDHGGRSGSPPRCGQGARTPIPRWPCTPWAK